MPLVTEQRKRQQKLVSILVIVFVETLGVVYFGALKGEPDKEVSYAGTSELKQILQDLKEFYLDTSILDDKKFQELKPYEAIGGDIETGRDNPFLTL